MPQTGHLRKHFPDVIDDFGFRAALRVNFLRLQHDNKVGLLRAHRVFRNLGPTSFADHRFDFGHFFKQHAVDFVGKFDRTGQRGIRQPDTVDGNGALVELRHKVGSEVGRQ